ncbi:MAG TPA: SMC family ATPase, partial [Nitratifractor sp.]|nr:SMC family ATPase [Nitratifractor sp.]
YKEALSVKDTLNQKMQNALVQETKLNGKIKGMKERLQEEHQKSKRVEKKIVEREDLEKLKAYLITFKSAINSQVTPRISQIASELFFEITNGRYQHIEVDEAFEFYIFDEGKRYPLERFSGGEVDLANLVLRIAISKTLNELSSNSSIGFLAFDEVFGSQDQQRRYAIMESFNKISQHYREIFLISHDPEIKELFERVIEL